MSIAESFVTIQVYDKITPCVEDDSLSNQALLRRQLTYFGFVVETANNGREAIEKIQTESFDLITLDSQMPVMNGSEACQWIKENQEFQEISVLFVTEDPKINSELADKTLMKPIKRSTLLSTFESIFQKTASG